MWRMPLRGVGDIACVAGDDVEMELGDGLAGSRAVVEAEVEGVGRWSELRGQVLLGPVDPDEKAGLFGGGQLLEPGDRAARDNESMAGGDGEFVGDHSKEVVEGEEGGR